MTATLDRNADLTSLLQSALPRALEIRHDLHMHPELMFEEARTAKLVMNELKTLGIECKGGFAKGTGVIGYLPANAPGASQTGTVALRADMDALPINEETGKPYASKTPGIMHACGHDGHTTILLTVARVLSKMQRPHPVLFVFQPAEEGGGGADHMVKEGALDGEAKGGLGEPVTRMFGLHGWPSLEIGTVATRPGPLLAATDEIEVTIHGTQCHAAFPHLGTDTVVASASVINTLQTIPSRSIAPTDSCIVTIATIHAGTANNVIPASVHMTGTVRTLSDETRALTKKRFFEVVNHTAQAHDCRAEIHYEEGYPVTRNDDALAAWFLDTARGVIGDENVLVQPTAVMGGEDFSYYCNKVPSCFFFLGIRPKGQETYPSLHQPDFDFNDDAIEIGVQLMCACAIGN
ncbi:MAG: amidohydrolase [Phycisphaeraceae bacterium]|nr:amidohydrolase [Phycisphaerales bacterium]MCB9859485.1 amidohydrolase [Phycisphaeraceae bacterium]